MDNGQSQRLSGPEGSRDETPAAEPGHGIASAAVRPPLEPKPSPESPPKSWRERSGLRRERPRSSGYVEQRELRGVVLPQPAINAAQAVMLLIGIAYVGIGSVALGRGGFSALNLHNQVMGIDHTPLLGFMELLFGAVVILAAALPYAARWVLITAGSVQAVWGLVIVITSGTFNAALGVEPLNGWIFIITGIATFVVGLVMPKASDWRRSA